MHSLLSAQAALQGQVHSLSKSLESLVSSAELQQFAQRQQTQAADLEQQISAQVQPLVLVLVATTSVKCRVLDNSIWLWTD